MVRSYITELLWRRSCDKKLTGLTNTPATSDYLSCQSTLERDAWLLLFHSLAAVTKAVGPKDQKLWHKTNVEVFIWFGPCSVSYRDLGAHLLHGTLSVWHTHSLQSPTWPPPCPLNRTFSLSTFCVHRFHSSTDGFSHLPFPCHIPPRHAQIYFARSQSKGLIYTCPYISFTSPQGFLSLSALQIVKETEIDPGSSLERLSFDWEQGPVARGKI